MAARDLFYEAVKQALLKEEWVITGDHYQLLDIGWEEYNRIYNCFIHIDIKDGKIWIQENMTENDLAQELVEMGVNKEDIILGLHPPYKRPYTGYGVA